MNVTSLIDAMVRQTSVLLAQLATSGGGRAQLANTANQVFLDLVGSLREQGLGSRVIADMFGLALRTYQERVRKLSESRTIRGKSLWEAVRDHIELQGPILRADVLQRFRYDDVESVRGVLRDLTHAGLVYRTGRGDAVTYRALEREQLTKLAAQSEESLLNVVHIAVQQRGPLSRAELCATTALAEDALGHALDALLERELIRREGTGSDERFSSDGCALPYNDPKGWEAAVFDHYQALVGALCAKLELGTRGADLADVIGGSTFGFEVWPGHPNYDEVRGLLKSFRTTCGDLRARVADHNRSCVAPVERERVITYFGQNVLSEIVEEQNDET
ncbi:MAG TPA: hypothetical protein VHM70_15670 [Polyangiaceae bacterium]|jgi:hypothetical protein|nr:hypothetical protein [Polyangiaceae bacterium]